MLQSSDKAVELHCCSKTTKDTSVRHTVALGDMFLHYNENGEWVWEEEGGYEVIAGKKTPNIIVFSDNQAINGSGTGTDYVTGLSKQEDESLGYQNPLIMIAKTPLKNRVEAFKEVLKTASKVQEVESI